MLLEDHRVPLEIRFPTVKVIKVELGGVVCSCDARRQGRASVGRRQPAGVPAPSLQAATTSARRTCGARDYSDQAAEEQAQHGGSPRKRRLSSGHRAGGRRRRATRPSSWKGRVLVLLGCFPLEATMCLIGQASLHVVGLPFSRRSCGRLSASTASHVRPLDAAVVFYCLLQCYRRRRVRRGCREGSVRPRPRTLRRRQRAVALLIVPRMCPFRVGAPGRFLCTSYVTWLHRIVSMTAWSTNALFVWDGLRDAWATHLTHHHQKGRITSLASPQRASRRTDGDGCKTCKVPPLVPRLPA